MADRVDALAASYELCRRLHARHGRTYYLASQLLPPDQRSAVSALYGFARYVDDIVDVEMDVVPDPERVERIRTMLHSGLERGSSDHPILAATVDTVQRFGIERAILDDFLDSMKMDIAVTSYDTWADLCAYTWGSAAVIGLQMVRVIGAVVPQAEADAFAAKLGEAFQLTNFCRDVAEDAARGRTYLPLEDFRAEGASTPPVDSPQTRRVVARNVRRARDLYADAEPGIDLLHPNGRECVRVAFVLYQRILDEIEVADFDVFSARRSVGNTARLRVALPAIGRAWVTRTRGRVPASPTRTG